MSPQQWTAAEMLLGVLLVAFAVGAWDWRAGVAVVGIALFAMAAGPRGR